MHIAIIYSLPTRRLRSTPFGAIDDDTAVIARAVALGLKSKGYAVSLHPISEDNIDSILQVKADCIFNLIEWCGLDIALSQQAFAYLRQLNIPVTGNSEKLFVLSGDKAALKQALLAHGLPVPAAQVFATGQEPISPALPYPVLVKPSLEHCSMGLGPDTIAHNAAELIPIVQKQIKQFTQPVLAEEFVDGREFEAYLLEEKGKVRVLPIEEVVFHGPSGLRFQTYSAKWEEKSSDYQTTDVVLAQLTEAERKSIESVCRRTFLELGFAGYARIDLRLRAGQPYILEANANPSVYDDEGELTDPNKEVIWGIKFSDYVAAIVDSAFYHFQKGDKI